ncbi:MAG: hypothetical protein ACOYN4_21070 [Bacteroidales bacterium]
MSNTSYLVLLMILFASNIFAQSVGINSTGDAPNPSAILDVSSTTKGFLPPRMTTVQRNAITNPTEGLVIYNTDEKSLNLYVGAWVSMNATMPCGSIITINHIAGVVAPVTKTTTYGTVTNILGEPSKCWITSNLGSDHQATAESDATEASAGWYWQFNSKQGYKHDGIQAIPNSTWIMNINENSNWTSANDPCKIELGSTWHIPTFTDWNNVNNAYGWASLSDMWNSGLKLHAAGFLINLGVIEVLFRGEVIRYWSSSQESNSDAYCLYFPVLFGSNNLSASGKNSGLPVRCVREY